MDIVTSEARSLAERMILEDRLANEDITVKEEPLITSDLVPDFPRNVKEEPERRTPSSPPFFKTEVIDLVDDDDNDNDGSDRDRDGGEDTSLQTPLVTDFLAVDLEEESRTTTSPPPSDNIEVEKESKTTTSDNIEGNAGPQHSTVKQPDVRNSVKHNASDHASLKPVEINSEASIAQEPECCEPIQINPHSKPSQTNTKPNSVQEPQCLGPFVELSTIKCPKCSVMLTEYYEILNHSCIDEHIAREEMKQKLKCCFCEKGYGNVRSLKKHIKTYVKRTYVKCSVCGVRLTSVSSFNAHALMHTNQWPYRCDICGHGSASEHHLEMHKTIHTNEKPWMCDVCGAMFPNQLRLNNHKVVHSERKYECDLCSAKFRERYKLKKHKKNVHSVRKKEFQCEECSSAFTTSYALKIHKEMKHDDNSSRESFICSVCNKEFIHRFTFNRHMNMHKHTLENVIYTCDMCKRNFARKGSLTRHILEHSGKQFSCSHCGMLFTQPSSVKRHVLKLHATDR